MTTMYAMQIETVPVIVPRKLATIKRIVASAYGITEDELCSTSRQSRLVHARQVAFYLCRGFTNRSYAEIGRAFGNRDSSTVLYGVRKITSQIVPDSDITHEMWQLRDAVAKALK